MSKKSDSKDTEYWKGKRVLVTGAAGFIGSHLTESMVPLCAHTRALVQYRSDGRAGWLEGSASKMDIEILAGDVRDRDSVRRAVEGSDVVFHLAALIGIPYSYEAPLSYVHTNAEGTFHVLTACRDSGVGLMVQTSTSEVYGSAQQVPISESHPLQAQSPYSASKIAADKFAEAFHLSFDVPVVTVRPFNTYGPRQSPRAIIPAIMTQLLQGNDLRLGNTETTRDLNFVLDTVRGFRLAAQSPEAVGEVVNLGTGKEISIGDLATMIMSTVGVNRSVVVEDQRVRPSKSEVMRLCADNTKARTLLGWEPEYSLEEGLKITFEWVQQNLDAIAREEYAV